MANVSPFRGIHYNTHKVNLADVITPPYDVISAEDAPGYLNRSPYNFAHVDLPHQADDDYSHAATLLAKWRELSILVEEPTPGFYLYQQAFKVNGIKHSRQTLMAAVGLADFSEGIIRPHENTFGKYKEDRLRQMSKTHCNLSHIFAMVKDREGFLASIFEQSVYQTPLLTAKADDGVEHTLWHIDVQKNAAITAFFSDKPLYIVDGHHRYESALRYARESGALGQKDHPAAQTLFAIANAYDPALVVLPTHRYVRDVPTEKLALDNIEHTFDIIRLNLADLKRVMSKPPPVPCFGLYLNDDLYLCTPKHFHAKEESWGKSVAKLSVAWSDNVFLAEYCGIDDTNRREKVSYGKDVESLWDKRAQASAIIFHAPPAIDDVISVADEHKFMPQKSTYFYPKIFAGLMIRALA